MSIQRFFPLLLAAALTVGLSACGEEIETLQPTPTPSQSQAQAQESAQPMEFVLPCYPEAGFHPLTSNNRTNLALMGLVYDTLFELDEQFQPQFALATAASSADGLSWTIAIREGVTFSDGTPLTAAHVVSCLNAARQSTLYSARLAGITSVTGAGNLVTVALSSPNGNLPALLDIPIFLENGGAVPLGTGDYTLVGSDKSWHLELRDQGWRRERPKLETIRLYAIDETDDLIYAFDTREISLVGSDITGTSALGFSGNAETVDYATSDMLYVGFNTASGICTSATVRRALSQGIDRETIAASALSHHAVATALPIHPNSPFFDAGINTELSYSLQTMSTMLTEAGWSQVDGKWSKGHTELALKLIVNQENSYKVAAANAIAASLGGGGVTVTVETLPWDSYTAALTGGDYDLYLGEVRLTADFDPTVLIGPAGALNYSRWTDADTAALLSAYRAAQGDTRKTAAAQLCLRLGEQMPFAPLGFKNWSILSQWGQTAGASPTQQNIFHDFAQWEIAG